MPKNNEGFNNLEKAADINDSPFAVEDLIHNLKYDINRLILSLNSLNGEYPNHGVAKLMSLAQDIECGLKASEASIKKSNAGNVQYSNSPSRRKPDTKSDSSFNVTV